jgi:hypothetical protein
VLAVSPCFAMLGRNADREMYGRELASRELSHILAGECIRGVGQPEWDLRTGFAAQSEELRTDGSRRWGDTIAPDCSLVFSVPLW